MKALLQGSCACTGVDEFEGRVFPCHLLLRQRLSARRRGKKEKNIITAFPGSRPCQAYACRLTSTYQALSHVLGGMSASPPSGCMWPVGRVGVSAFPYASESTVTPPEEEMTDWPARAVPVGRPTVGIAPAGSVLSGKHGPVHDVHHGIATLRRRWQGHGCLHLASAQSL